MPTSHLSLDHDPNVNPKLHNVGLYSDPEDLILETETAKPSAALGLLRKLVSHENATSGEFLRQVVQSGSAPPIDEHRRSMLLSTTPRPTECKAGRVMDRATHDSDLQWFQGDLSSSFSKIRKSRSQSNPTAAQPHAAMKNEAVNNWESLTRPSDKIIFYQVPLLNDYAQPSQERVQRLHEYSILFSSDATKGYEEHQKKMTIMGGNSGRLCRRFISRSHRPKSDEIMLLTNFKTDKDDNDVISAQSNHREMTAVKRIRRVRGFETSVQVGRIRGPVLLEKDDRKPGDGFRNQLNVNKLSTARRVLFHCPRCNYSSDRKNNLKRHVIAMHRKSDRRLECCGDEFDNKASLRYHVMNSHVTGYECSACRRHFRRKALYTRHLVVHNGYKEYGCSQCNYATSHRSNLIRHHRVHDTPTSIMPRHQAPPNFYRNKPVAYNTTPSPHKETPICIQTSPISRVASDFNRKPNQPRPPPRQTLEVLENPLPANSLSGYIQFQCTRQSPEHDSQMSDHLEIDDQMFAPRPFNLYHNVSQYLISNSTGSKSPIYPHQSTAYNVSKRSEHERQNPQEKLELDAVTNFDSKMEYNSLDANIESKAEFFFAKAGHSKVTPSDVLLENELLQSDNTFSSFSGSQQSYHNEVIRSVALIKPIQFVRWWI